MAFLVYDLAVHICSLLPKFLCYDPYTWLGLLMTLLPLYHICFLLLMFFSYDSCSWFALLMILLSIYASVCLNSFVVIHAHGLACYDLAAYVFHMLLTACIPMLWFMFMACFSYDVAVYVWHILILLPIYIKEYVFINQCPYALGSPVLCLRLCPSMTPYLNLFGKLTWDVLMIKIFSTGFIWTFKGELPYSPRGKRTCNTLLKCFASWHLLLIHFIPWRLNNPIVKVKS